MNFWLIKIKMNNHDKFYLFYFKQHIRKEIEMHNDE